jgi:hypothetical protein
MTWLSRAARSCVPVAWLLCGVGLATATTLELRYVWLMPPTPPEVARDITVTDAKDLQGRSASFRILLFSDEFRWRLSSYEATEEGAVFPGFTDEMKAVLDSAREIICVGASSEELAAGTSLKAGRAQEEWRAGRRAERIAVWVRQGLSAPIPVRKLNIGHHAPTKGSTNTSDQRRVVIILVLDHDKDANIDESLRSAMTQEAARSPIFDSLLSDYSLGAGKAFTWVP